MHCTHCDARLSVGDTYCPRCGVAVTASATGQTQRLEEPEQEASVVAKWDASQLVSSMVPPAPDWTGGFQHCPRCRSWRVVPNQPVLTQNTRDELVLDVDQSPPAPGTTVRTTPIRAWVCGACGYLELYVSDHETIYQQYERRDGS